MKRVARIFAMAAMVCGFTYAFTACEQKEEFEEPTKEVVFSAATSYENLPETRTVYSGKDFNITGNQGTERIDWVEGTDKIKVLNANTNETAVYTVGAPSANGAKSEAAVTADANKLTWSTDGNPNTFLAVYPSTVNYASNTFSASIPALQSQDGTHPDSNNNTVTNPTMSQYAYMVAEVPNATSGTNVTLPFVPAMTAFEFNVAFANDGGTPPTISSFDMISTSTALTGTWTWTGGSTFSCPAFAANSNDKITVNFNNQTIDNNHPLRFTVFALPQNITQVKLVFHLSTGDKTLSLKQNGAWTNFTACKKYRITTPGLPGGEVWTYYVEEIADINTHGHLATPNLPFTVKSYRKNNVGTYQAVKWKVQYSTSANGPWSDTQPSAWQTGGAKFSITNTTGNGSLPTSAGEADYANILRDHNTSSTEYETDGAIDDTQQAAIATMKSRGTLPSTTSDAGDGYFDLSKHPIYPVSAIDGSETTQETANCYVITRPGKYKFPLVYGNAINENASSATSGNNTMAYAPQGLSASNSDNCRYFLRRFVRHDDKPITNPWIHSNGFTVDNAVVVWQDVPDASMQILLDSDISISNNYVKFQIREANIRPGNIQIAARASDGTILWSWHLWVTEKDLSPHAVTDGAGNSLNMMNFNLGWTDKVSGHGEHWVDWPFYVRVIQTDASGNILNTSNPEYHAHPDEGGNPTGAADVFCVTQYGESISVKGNVGSNTFYQWGRKDPLLPAASNNTNKSIYSAAYSLSDIVESGVKVKTVRDDNGTIGQSIKVPYNVFWSRASEQIQTHNSNGTNGSVITKENHLFIGKATNDNGQSRGTAWFGNLWDTGLIAYIGTSGGNNAVSVNNRFPIKSVYDPSPRGYVVPYIFAFTGFSTAAYNRTDAGTPRGSLSSDREGYNFNDGNGGTIFLPFAGARGGDGNNPLYDVNATMYYWTTGKLPYDDAYGSMHKSKRMAFFRDGHIVTPGSPEIYGQSDEYSEGAYSIRPVLQTAF